MTPDQITQLRQCLKNIEKYYTKRGGRVNSPMYVRQQLKQALALLPCPTCNGTGKSLEYAVVCPECGCEEYTDENQLGNGYRQCRRCHQDWWLHIKYAIGIEPCPDCR